MSDALSVDAKSRDMHFSCKSSVDDDQKLAALQDLTLVGFASSVNFFRPILAPTLERLTIIGALATFKTSLRFDDDTANFLQASLPALVQLTMCGEGLQSGFFFKVAE